MTRDEVLPVIIFPEGWEDVDETRGIPRIVAAASPTETWTWKRLWEDAR